MATSSIISIDSSLSPWCQKSRFSLRKQLYSLPMQYSVMNRGSRIDRSKEIRGLKPGFPHRNEAYNIQGPIRIRFLVTPAGSNF